MARLRVCYKSRDRLRHVDTMRFVDYNSVIALACAFLPKCFCKVSGKSQVNDSAIKYNNFFIVNGIVSRLLRAEKFMEQFHTWLYLISVLYLLPRRRLAEVVMLWTIHLPVGW